MSPVENLEGIFASLEVSATASAKSAASVRSVARQLEKAAQLGDVGKIQRLLTKLDQVRSTLGQDVKNTIASWHVSDEEIIDYLSTQYEGELISQARAVGLEIRVQDDRLVAYPSLVRIIPGSKVLEIDRKRHPILRPSRLVQLLLGNQQKKPSTKPEQFLETLLSAYRLVSHDGLGHTVALNEIYKALTLLPATRKEYSKPDFTRDLYTLETSDVKRTKSNATYSLPASTGTKSTKNVLTFVSLSGEQITYYGIRFTQAVA